MMQAAFGLILSVLGSAGMFASTPPKVAPYELAGYMDEAPAGAKILDQLTIVRDGKQRSFLVTEASTAFGRASELSRAVVPAADFTSYLLTGNSEAATQMMDAGRGAHVHGSFVRMRFSSQLAIQEVQTAEPKAAAQVAADPRS